MKAAQNGEDNLILSAVVPSDEVWLGVIYEMLHAHCPECVSIVVGGFDALNGRLVCNAEVISINQYVEPLTPGTSCFYCTNGCELCGTP